MCPGVGLMVETVGMGGMWCSFATRRAGTWVCFAAASTSELAGDGVAKVRIDTALVEMSC